MKLPSGAAAVATAVTPPSEPTVSTAAAAAEVARRAPAAREITSSTAGGGTAAARTSSSRWNSRSMSANPFIPVPLGGGWVPPTQVVLRRDVTRRRSPDRATRRSDDLFQHLGHALGHDLATADEPAPDLVLGDPLELGDRAGRQAGHVVQHHGPAVDGGEPPERLEERAGARVGLLRRRSAPAASHPHPHRRADRDPPDPADGRVLVLRAGRLGAQRGPAAPGARVGVLHRLVRVVRVERDRVELGDQPRVVGLEVRAEVRPQLTVRERAVLPDDRPADRGGLVLRAGPRVRVAGTRSLRRDRAAVVVRVGERRRAPGLDEPAVRPRNAGPWCSTPCPLVAVAGPRGPVPITRATCPFDGYPQVPQPIRARTPSAPPDRPTSVRRYRNGFAATRSSRSA